MSIVLDLIGKALYFYSFALIIYILMSWFPNSRETGIGQFLARISEPYLEPFRRFVPPLGMIDISPIVAFFVLRLAGSGLDQLAMWLA